MADKYDNLPTFHLVRRIIDWAEIADRTAMAADGPVPKTWEVMHEDAKHEFFRCSYLLAKRVERLLK